MMQKQSSSGDAEKAPQEPAMSADVPVESDRHESVGNDEAGRSFEHIRQALRGLRYGEVSITVQDGVVVQVERTERKRVRRTER